MTGLSRIFQFLSIDKEFVYELEDAHFLSAFVEGAVRLNDASIYKTLAYIVTLIAQVAYIGEIVSCQEALMPCVRGELAPRILPAYEMCAKYPQCIAHMKKSQLPGILNELLANPQVAQSAAKLLAVLRS